MVDDKALDLDISQLRNEWRSHPVIGEDGRPVRGGDGRFVYGPERFPHNWTSTCRWPKLLAEMPRPILMQLENGNWICQPQGILADGVGVDTPGRAVALAWRAMRTGR